MSDPAEDLLEMLGGPEETKVDLIQDDFGIELANREKTLSHKRAVQERLEDLTNELLQESMSKLAAALRFASVDPEASEPPATWLAEFGETQAKELYRIARMANLPAHDAPVGLKIAQQVAIGIYRTKAQDNAVPHTLNVQLVQFQGPVVNYPTKKVER